MKKIVLVGWIVVWGNLLFAQDTLVMPVTGNGGVYNTCYAMIIDNGLDSNYANDVHATITVAPLWVENISLYFEEFNTEIYFDSLTIYDGPGTTFPVIGVYSGNQLSGQTVMSTTNAITLEFRSDDISTGTGFKAWVSCTVGLEDEMQEELTLYPNPASTYLQLTGIEPENIEMISIIDGTGRSIKTFEYEGETDISQLSAGFYGLYVQTKKGETFYKTWIKH